MRHARFVFFGAVSSVLAVGLVEGCGSGTPSCPPGDVCTSASDQDSGKNIGNPADGGTTDSGGSTACTADAGKVDDNPACNDCAYANCCTQIAACQADPNCEGLQQCIAACDPSDTECLLTCQVEYDPTTLQNVGTCAQVKCKSECGSVNTDAGFDAGL